LLNYMSAAITASFLAHSVNRITSSVAAAALVLVFLLPTRSHAQDANPLELSRQSVPDLLGVVVGPSFHSQIGSFDTGCPCTFDGGAGAGVAFGVSYDKNILSYGTSTKGQLWLGGRLMFETRNVTALFREYELVKVQSLAMREQTFETPVQFRHRALAQFSLITFTPYLQWNPFGNFFAQVGFQAGVVTASSMTHTKELLDKIVVLPNGERANVNFIDQAGKPLGDVLTVGEGEDFKRVNTVNTLQLAATATVGMDIPISLGKSDKQIWRVTPMLNYVLPLTDMLVPLADKGAQGSGFRISALQILVSLKLNLEKQN
jgi:hypothetical protein